MRPPVPKEVRRSHLLPCPRCGEANGVTAIACWKCDLQLMPDKLLEPRRAAGEATPSELPVVDAEVSEDTLDRMRAARPLAHDGPHTLPPFATPREGGTANDPHFGPGLTPVQRRRVLMAGAVVLAAAVVAWFVPRPADAPPAVPTVAAQRVTPVAAPIAAPVPAPTVAPQPQRAAAPRAEVSVPAPAPVATPHAVLAPAATQGMPSRPAAAPRAAAPRAFAAQPREPDAARRIDAEVQHRPPPPVQAPCTPQIAALGLCALDSK